MAEAREPGSGWTPGVVFKLDRFEFTGDDRLELSGRWFGVRGRRFVRPTLTLLAGGERHRSLADLADKPWPAQDGDMWQATFPCDADVVHGLDEAEFTVAPDITIALPAPAGVPGGRARRTEDSEHREPAKTGAPDPDERAKVQERTLRTSAETAVRRQLALVTRELQRDRAEKERLQRELERSESERASSAARLDEALGSLTAAGAERDQALQAREHAAAERDDALRAGEQATAERDHANRAREQAIAERDAALRARDEALRARDQALNAREDATAELGAAVEARDQASAQRDAAIDERDRTITELDQERRAHERTIGQALGARDQALTARDQAIAERDALAGSIEKLKSDRAEAISARGAALVMRNSVQAGPAARRNASPLRWVITIVVVLACLVALAFLVHVF